MKLIKEFKDYLKKENKSENTVDSYIIHIRTYFKWYRESFNNDPELIFRENVLDYKSYMLNVKKLDPGTVNAKLSALSKFNDYLIEYRFQQEKVLDKKDNVRIQSSGINPACIEKQEVEKLRQDILTNENKRDYAIVTIMAYAGLRISEVLNLRLGDISLESRELLVRKGKGDKYRSVIINDKIINAIKSYLKERNSSKRSDSEYLFVSRQGKKVSRSRINQIFNKHSDKITPHSLRHFYCTNALENGFSVYEVANQAGHTNINTTMIYTNPSLEQMKEKANQL